MDTYRSKNAHKIITLLQLHNLVAVNTFFKPQHRCGSVNTFRQTKQGGRHGANHGEAASQNDLGEHVGDYVLTKYKGGMVKGRVMAMLGTDEGEKRWIVRFADGYVKRYGEKELRKILIVKEKEKIGKAGISRAVAEQLNCAE